MRRDAREEPEHAIDPNGPDPGTEDGFRADGVVAEFGGAAEGIEGVANAAFGVAGCGGGVHAVVIVVVVEVGIIHITAIEIKRDTVSVCVEIRCRERGCG